MKKINSIISYIISTIIILLIWYKTLPVLNVFFWGLPILLLFFGVFICLIDSVAKKKINKFGVLFLIVGIIFITIVPFITSSPIFHSSKYRNIIGSIEESTFLKDISTIDVNNIRLVDQKMAMKLGDKKIGEDPALGSQAELGEFSIQKVNNSLYWVAPLLHRSFWKWKDNREGTNGYVMVSASNPQDVKLVQKLGDSPIKIKYQPNGFFNDYLKRHVYFHGYANIGMTDFTFEIDDNGKPYWVITLFKKEVGYGGNNAIGVVLVDAQSGKIERYDIADAPSWVDRIQPERFIKTQLNHWGIYVKGWLNSFLSEDKVLKVTPGMSLVYGDDNNSYWYTGITSSGNDESTVGFVLVNTRTKETKFYKQSGATELAAMSSAEGKVQEKNYKATFPIMYNILGVPTYVCSLKDKAGLIKLVAMVSVEDYSILGVGETKNDALRSYRNSLKSKGNFIAIDDIANEEKIEGQVLRISADVRNGVSYYYLLISGKEINIFIATSDISLELPLTNVGDTVFIKYSKGKSVFIDISEFDNKDIEVID
ncbi:MAG: hypothetical protein KAX49_11555 [Halanaerobiales bacterium]|nr:hypothetical protein [Halanaerobiales bacterium]